MISVDSQVLNYSQFLPGKMLGSTLSVGNLSNCEQIVELSVDSLNPKFSKKMVKEKFQDPELPFNLNDACSSDDGSINNSEVKHEAWYIENPVTRELTKRITLKLGPKAEQDFIIVVRAPTCKKSENLLAVINIGLLTYADEQFGLTESFEEFLKTKFKGLMKDFLKDRKKVSIAQRLEILLAGRIEIPNIVCQKSLRFEHDAAFSDEQVVPLAIKKMEGQQKFRIPFQNRSN
jgi:hypothetical protein